MPKPPAPRPRVRDGRERTQSATVVWLSARATERGQRDDGKSQRPHSTDETGELSPAEDPGEERKNRKGASGHGTFVGTYDECIEI